MDWPGNYRPSGSNERIDQQSGDFSSTSRSSSQQTVRSKENNNFLNVLKERAQQVLGTQQGTYDHFSTEIASQTLHDISINHQTADAYQTGTVVRPNHSSHHMEMQPFPNGSESQTTNLGSNDGRPANSDDFYSIDWTPKEIFLKYRQHVEGFRLGANYEVNGGNTKLVFKPLVEDRKWKVVWQPKYGDVRLLTKKIPIGSLLSFQAGIGHDFNTHTTEWKWKITSSLGGTAYSEIRHKTSLPLWPGFDVRVGWNAEYVLPDLHGALGIGEPALGLNFGHLYASIERVEAIVTCTT